MLVSSDKLKAVEHAPGLFSIKLIDGSRGAGQLAMLHGWLKPGAQHARHTHDTEELVYVMSGEGTMELRGREFPVRAGDAVRLPPNSLHATRNTHACDDLVFIAAFADQIIDARAWTEGGSRSHPESPWVPLFNRGRWALRRLSRCLRSWNPN
jgi:quercetin dioxygenase-like cupin family protein